MITPAIRYISSFQDATNSSSIPVPTPVMVDGRIWDQKNLNVSSYRSGRVIPQVKTGWSTLTTGAWRYYNDNPASATVYGRLYNWYALMGIYDAASLADPSLRDNIAPVGWEVATYGEWRTLRNILGRSTAGQALKELGPAHWGPTNTGTNSSYFTALPGGYKYYGNNTGFNRLGVMGFWWMKDYPTTNYFRLTSTSDLLGEYYTSSKNYGFSIRLIKDTTEIPGFETTTPTPTLTSLLGAGGYIPTSYSAGIIEERGIVYGTSINPTIANTRIQIGDGTGEYTTNITGLQSNTEYYIRAYAISSTDGLVYAPNISVFTLNSTPIVYTTNISYITTNSAESGGSIDNEGGIGITAKGVCWSTSPFPIVTLPTKTNNGSGDTDFLSEITGLALNTKYYVRAYATTSSTTVYGGQKEFTTLAVVSPNLIFNQYPAYHAYSLRRLSDTANNRCVRVRRTTASPDPVTTTTVDVFFNSYSEIGLYSDIINVSGTATEAITLGEFAQGVVDGLTVPSSIFVVTWFDQSGNNKNATRSNTGQQPRLVNVVGGIVTLETSEGKATVRFTATEQDSLSVNDGLTQFNNVSSFVVGNSIANTTLSYLGLDIDGATRFYFPGANGISYVTSNTFTGFNNVSGENKLYEIICGTSTTSAYSNGIQLSPASVQSVNTVSANIHIGRVGAAIFASYADGYISEIISFVGTPTPNRINIEQNMSDYYGIQRLPLVTTADANYIEPTGTAIGGGNLIDEFGITPTVKGVCWNTSENPTIDSGPTTNDGVGIGAFTSNLTFLEAYTTYYVRAYAANSAGISYGAEEKQFTTGAVTIGSFILDLYPSAYHAYSLRRLKSTYPGACLRVRRTTTTPSVTTTTVDLYFDTFNAISLNSVVTYTSGTITTARYLGEFCAAPGFVNTDGYNACEIFVSTWFDQSGNNKNVINATLSQQPRLVRLATGVATLETSGGKAAVRFTSGSAQRLTLIDTSVSLNNVSSYALGNSLATANNAVMSLGDTINTNLFWLPQTTSIAYRNTTIWSNGNVANTPRLYELICSSSVINAYANGNILTPVSVQAPMTGTNPHIKLGWYSTNVLMNGYISEVISFVGTANRTQIESNINTYYNVW